MGRGRVIFSEKTSCLVNHKCLILWYGGIKAPIDQQPSQNRFLCVKNLITTISFLFKRNLHRIVYIPIAVVMGATTVQTNQKAAFRSRDPNGPISVQNEIT